ncbi:hypothetical protein U9M48_011377 [Paspalum notatum var. saurae]|uniref:Peptidase A1 domain-containing protein n=1 Tax=Paspalum notatum var. saurae TaxID=547442 RepID=A0AAQ3SVL7_PASNO
MMHNKHNLPQAALLLVASLAALSAAIVSCDAAAVRLQLVHTDAGRGLSRLELLQRMAARTKARAARFLTGTGGSSASAPVTPGEIQPAPSGVVPGVPDTEYLVHLGIGTPPQPVQLTLDTGSDLVWTQCQPCTVACFPQSLPYFDPSLSSTFAGLACDTSPCQALAPSSNSQACAPGSGQACSYTYGYGDGSVTMGFLDTDTFSFAAGDTTTAVSGLAFGCGVNNTGIFKSNETGIAGFGRGNLSLPSQLKADNFSYCFTDITGTAPSPVLLGLPANLYSVGAAVQTTPLNHGPPSLPSSLYFVSLTGISVGSTSVTTGGGSTIVDSGTGMTSLPQDVYAAVADAFVQQVSLSVHNSTSISQLCFTVPAPAGGQPPDVPKLVLQFDGATLDLPRASYMFEVEDNGVSVTCLALNNAGAASETIVIGNYQQQNLHVLFDLANNTLSFLPAQCDQV